jgi:hypothetical protein
MVTDFRTHRRAPFDMAVASDYVGISVAASSVLPCALSESTRLCAGGSAAQMSLAYHSAASAASCLALPRH